MLIQGKLIDGYEDLSEIYKIRKKVFAQKVSISDGVISDELDYIAIHAVVYEGTKQNRMVATGRMVYDGDTCKIGRIAILKEFRGKKYGDFIVRMLLNKAFQSGMNQVYAEAQLENIGFYKKIGFRPLETINLESREKYHKMIIDKDQVLFPCKQEMNR